MKRITIFLVLTITTSFSLTAQQTYVPDDNFEARLIDLGYDTVLDDYVATANIEGITELVIDDTEISDLTGIENFTALVNLNCSYNLLTDIDISNNTALTHLYCDNNQLTSVDLSANIALTHLYCDNNQLTSLDLSLNTALTRLFCRNNQLTSLDLSANTALTHLYCADNQFTSLDLSANTALGVLSCANNQLTSLDVSNNTALTHLDCPSNQLTVLDVKNGTNTSITSFNATSNPNLTCIFVDDIVYSTTNWTEIDAASTFVATQAECDAIMTYVPDDNFEQALIDLGYDIGALDDYVPTANIENITNLEIIGKNILDLTGIEDFVALVDLNCAFNFLTDIDVSNNLALTHLNFVSNQLVSLDLSLNTALTSLNCRNNQLTSLNLSFNTSLQFLHCENNQITSLDLSLNIALIELHSENNQLITLDVRNGNYSNFLVFNTIENPDLTCIFVDDAAYSTANWTEIDAASTFVETAAECDALGINDFVNSSFKIYPNPVKDSFSIQTSLDITAIEIVDVFGKLVKTANTTNAISLSQLHAGVYFVRIHTLKGVGTQRIIKQ